MENFEKIVQSYQQKINTFTIVEISDIPNIDLYIDQVTTFIDNVYNHINVLMKAKF